jgi:hypothetical protein
MSAETHPQANPRRRCGAIALQPTTAKEAFMFEIGVTPEGVIDHRFFPPNGG